MSGQQDVALSEAVAKFYGDPLGFVMMAFPWGEAGPLLRFKGPDRWQREFLEDWGREIRKRRFNGRDAVPPILMSVGAGRGIGKTALDAFVFWFIISTRPECKITVTANTWAQLDTRTWAAIKEWGERCITRHWFTVTSDRIYKVGMRDSWFGTAQTCKKENSQSFAGQQSASSSSVYLCDESSTIDDLIFEVAESGLGSGEPMMFLFGNVTKNTGKLHRTLFGSERDKWNGRSVDSRTCMLPPKAKIAEEIAMYGEDSDYVRVWIRGLAPKQGDMQFIDTGRVREAQARTAQALMDDPLIAGLDCSRGGADAMVMRFRRGRDARTIPPLVLAGNQTRDSMQMAA